MNMHLTGMDGGPVEVPADAYTAFKTGFRGVLLTPQDAAFDETRKLWNGMIDRRPGLIARCTGTVDVVQAVRFAARHRLLLSVRSGGHNIAGLATNEGGLMLDMSLLRGIWVDPAGRTARAQAGCTLADLDRETQLHGLAAVLGFVSTTGIAGLTLGGGFGYLTRRHGWTCDTLVSMEVVMADGQVVRASAEEHAELFWALRGGGGNFGVVTAFEYRLFPVGPEILGGAIAWHGADARQVLQAYRDVSARAPRELTSVAVLRIAPPAPWLPPEIHGQPMAAIFVCHTGDTAEADALLAPLREVARPVADTVMRRPYVQMQSLLDATQPKGRRYYWKSHYLADIHPSLMDLAVEHAGRIASPFSALLMFQIQGALGEQSAGHSPAGNRDAAYVLNIAASWEKPEEDDLQLRWARDCFEATRGCSTGGVYVNFLTEEEGAERIQAAYGRTNLDRLATLKARYDPDNLFRGTKALTS
ncbi:MAG: FAD-binding oxidoreductase [Hydrogenophaga sp.]|uniref:FAD-binding oxidoreductase n=1 Tax=Hydrogenophaga sp. TaxID=1904254 RepID=UPI00271C8A04|nr:FAD-binding oxidoreductase [Hydrogenophaga sp.]MDO9132836.1 FAD-binding oxidoreductase [Hydrogenophaga sp.]MDP3325731.1 FAD-binding oxidoreductase [Hydrogenophaga sp.]